MTRTKSFLVKFKLMLVASLALLMLFALVACNKNNGPENSNDDSGKQYSGKGCLLNYTSKENLEFLYNFLYVNVQKENQTSGSYTLLAFNDDSADTIGIILLRIYTGYPDYAYGPVDVYGTIYKTNKLAEQAIGELFADQATEDTYIIKDNIVFGIDKDFKYSDNFQHKTYNSDDLPKEQKENINYIMDKAKNCNFPKELSVLFSNAVVPDTVENIPINHPVSLSEMVFQYRDNDISNCVIVEQTTHSSGEGAAEHLAYEELDVIQYYKDRMSEYTDDSFAEIDMNDSCMRLKVKTRPGFRFTDKATDEAYVSDYYYDGEEMLDVIIPTATPEGKAITGIKKDGANVFDANIHSVTISDSVIFIGAYAFSGCTGLTSVIFPDSVSRIDRYAFNDCKGLQTVTIGAGMARIDENAFSGCTGLRTVNWYSENYDERYAGLIFSDSGSIELHVDVTSIQESAFRKWDLQKVIIGEKVQAIGSYAFADCDEVTEIIIPKNVKSIGVGAFQNCDGMQTVVMEDGVLTIGDNAFVGCTNLRELYYCGTVEQWGTINHNTYAAIIPSSVNMYYLSEQPNNDGNHWHWSEQGKPEVWTD